MYTLKECKTMKINSEDKESPSNGENARPSSQRKENPLLMSYEEETSNAIHNHQNFGLQLRHD
jgi:hypothetical protein